MTARGLTPLETATLWPRRAETRVRERLIEAHAYLVPLTRARLLPRLPPRVSADDLDSEGYLALVRAVDTFAPERGVRFTSHAVTRIRGALLDYLRREDWVPRSVRTAQRRLRLAEAAGAPPAARAELETRAREVRVISLEELAAPGSATGEPDDPGRERLPDPHAGPEAVAVERVMAQALAACLWSEVRHLTPLQRQVCARRYTQDQSYDEIGAALRRSRSRIQQLHRQALALLRERLAPAWEKWEG